MTTLTSFQLQKLPVLDLASGEPGRPCSPRLRKVFDRTIENEVIILDDNDPAENEYPVMVFVDEMITAEEVTAHEQVEHTLRTRKLATIVLQRWWREESCCRRLANCFRQRLIKRSLHLWHRHSIFCIQRRTVRDLAQNAITSCQIKCFSANRIIKAWRSIRIRRFCKTIAAEGKRSLCLQQSADILWQHFSRYVAFRTSAVRIQRYWRRLLAIRSKIAAICSLQSWLWVIILSVRCSRMMYYIRLLQIRYRRNRLRKTFRNVVVLSYQNHVQTRLQYVIKLQARWRRLLCNRSLGGPFVLLRSKATVIQKFWRRFQAHQDRSKRKAQLQEKINACFKIQTAYRRLVSRRAIKARCSMISCVQSGIYSSIFSSCFSMLRGKAIVCQAGLLAVIAFDRHIERVQSVLVLQYLFRRRQRRKQFREIVEHVISCHMQSRSRSAIRIQASWRGFRCRTGHAHFSSLRSKTLVVQSYLRSYLVSKDFLRLKKHLELENRRQVLINHMESLPDSRDQRLQSLRARFSERLADIEGASPMQQCVNHSALPVKASILSALDAKRARLFRVKAQLDTVKNRKERIPLPTANNSSAQMRIVQQENHESKTMKVVRWRDHHGSTLVDSVNHQYSPKTLATPSLPCIKATSIIDVIPKKRAQRFMNVLSTTFGKAMSCNSNAFCENSSKSMNINRPKSAICQVSAKSPLQSGARRVKVTAKRSS